METFDFALIFLLIILVAAQSSALHNIDLAYNAKELGLVDDNGIIVQDTNSMYQRSIMFLWVNPIIIAGLVMAYIWNKSI